MNNENFEEFPRDYKVGDVMSVANGYVYVNPNIEEFDINDTVYEVVVRKILKVEPARFVEVTQAKRRGRPSKK